METLSAKSSGKMMASRLNSLCGESAKNLKASRLGGRSDTRRHQGGHVAAKQTWTVWVGLGLKTWGGLGAAGMEGMWHHYKAYFEVKGSFEGGVVLGLRAV